MGARQHLFALLSFVTPGMLFEKQASSPTGTTKKAANRRSKPRGRSHWSAPRSQDRGPSSAQPAGNSTARLTQPSQQRAPPSTHFLPRARVHSRLRAIQMFHLGDMTVANQPFVWQPLALPPSPFPPPAPRNPAPRGLPGWLFTCAGPALPVPQPLGPVPAAGPGRRSERAAGAATASPRAGYLLLLSAAAPPRASHRGAGEISSSEWQGRGGEERTGH